MRFVFLFPSPNILPNRSNGFRKGLLARMSHRVSLLGKKKKLETEMCIRSVLYIAREALRLIKQALSKTKMSSHRLSIFSKASCILCSPSGSDATVKDRKPLLCVATDPQNECPG